MITRLSLPCSVEFNGTTYTRPYLQHLATFRVIKRPREQQLLEQYMIRYDMRV